MSGDDEKESLFGDLNTAFESQWPCSVGSTFWEKTIGWSLSKARWPTKVELHPIEISATQEQEVGDVFDIVGYVLEPEEPDPTATIQQRKVVVDAVGDSCLNTIPLELLGRCARSAAVRLK